MTRLQIGKGDERRHALSASPSGPSGPHRFRGSLPRSDLPVVAASCGAFSPASGRRRRGRRGCAHGRPARRRIAIPKASSICIAISTTSRLSAPMLGHKCLSRCRRSAVGSTDKRLADDAADAIANIGQIGHEQDSGERVHHAPDHDGFAVGPHDRLRSGPAPPEATSSLRDRERDPHWVPGARWYLRGLGPTGLGLGDQAMAMLRAGQTGLFHRKRFASLWRGHWDIVPRRSPADWRYAGDDSEGQPGAFAPTRSLRISRRCRFRDRSSTISVAAVRPVSSRRSPWTRA